MPFCSDPVATPHGQKRGVVANISVLRHDAKHGFEELLGFDVPSLVQKEPSEIGARIDVVGVEFACTSKRGNRRDRVSEFDRADSEVVVQVRVVRIEFEGLLLSLPFLLEASQASIGRSEIRPGAGAVTEVASQLLENLQGLTAQVEIVIAFPEVTEGGTEAGTKVEVLWVQAEPRSKLSDRTAHILLLDQAQAALQTSPGSVYRFRRVRFSATKCDG